MRKRLRSSRSNPASGPSSARRSARVVAPLGATRTFPSKRLDTFPNPTPERDFLIHMEMPEFTCLCPMTGQPDFATLVLDYVPDRACVELKSLKLYVWSFRDEGAFHEAVTNRMLDDVVRAIRPRYARLVARFTVRGGIFTTVVAEHRKRGWKAAIELPALTMARAANTV